MPRVNSLLPLLMLAGAATATSASAEGAAYTIGISGEVPVVCRASLDTRLVPLTAGEMTLGKLREFCNSPNGYRVTVDHSPELADATLTVDGRTIAFSASGTTEVSRSDGAAIVSREISISLPEGAAPGSISFRISPAA